MLLQDEVQQELNEIKSSMTVLTSALLNQQATRECRLQEVAERLLACSHTSVCTSSHSVCTSSLSSVHGHNSAHCSEPRDVRSAGLECASPAVCAHANARGSLEELRRQASSSVDRALAQHGCVPGCAGSSPQRTGHARHGAPRCSRFCQHCSSEVWADQCCGSPGESAAAPTRLHHSDCCSAHRDLLHADCPPHPSGSSSADRAYHREAMSTCPSQRSACPCHEPDGGYPSTGACCHSTVNSPAEDAVGKSEDAALDAFVGVDVDGYNELSGKNVGPFIVQRFLDLKGKTRLAVIKMNALFSGCVAPKVASASVDGPPESSSPCDKAAAADENAEAEPSPCLNSSTLTDGAKLFSNCCPTTSVPKRVVDAAFKVIESVMASPDGVWAESCARCRRVASSNVDDKDLRTQAHSAPPPAVARVGESAVETEGTSAEDRNSDWVDPSACTGSLNPAESCANEQDRPLLSACNLDSEGSGDESVPAGKVGLHFSASSRVGSCNFGASAQPGTRGQTECNAFLVCVGKTDGSSAVFVQPVTPRGAIQFADSACQASDESVFTSVRETAQQDDSGRSEVSLAWCMSSSETNDSESDTCGAADNAKQRVGPLHGAVAAITPDSADGDAFPPASGVFDATKYQANSGVIPDSAFKAVSPSQASRSRNTCTRVASVFEGVCEVSHSGCEACFQPYDVSASPGANGAGSLTHQQEQDGAPDQRRTPSLSADSPAFSQESLSWLSDGGYSTSSLSDAVDPAFHTRASEVSGVSQGGRVGNSDDIVAAATRGTADEIDSGSGNGQGNSGQIIGEQDDGDGGAGMSSVDEASSVGGVSVIRMGNAAPYYGIACASGSADPAGAGVEDHHAMGMAHATQCGSSLVDPSFLDGHAVDNSDTGCSATDDAGGSLSGSGESDCQDSGTSAASSETNHHNSGFIPVRSTADDPLQTATGGTRAAFSLGTEPAPSGTADFSFSPVRFEADGLYTGYCDPGSAGGNGGGFSPGPSQGRRFSAPPHHLHPEGGGLHGQHERDFISPCSSFSSLSTATRPSPNSSATNLTHASSSNVDPFVSRYNPAWFGAGMSLSGSLISAPSRAPGGCGHDWRLGSRTGLGGSSDEDFRRRCCPSGLSGDVDVDARSSGVDGGEVLLTRSQSDEGLCGRLSVADDSRDSWVSLQLLNLSSRATRVSHYKNKKNKKCLLYIS